MIPSKARRWQIFIRPSTGCYRERADNIKIVEGLPFSCSAFDCYPFIPRARISDSLHDAHVSNAVFEIWMGTHAALRFHCREKIFFHTPLAFKFWREINDVQRAIAQLPRLHDVGS